MFEPPNYRKAFWKSRHHLWLAILTLGLGFASGEPLGLLAGATIYALGLVYLPDAGFFRRAVDARLAAARVAAEAAELATHRQQQEQALAALSPARRTRHQDLLTICRDLEAATVDPHASLGLETGSRRQKLDELSATFLRMLTIEQSLSVFLEAERKERIPALVADLEAETRSLANEVTSLKQVTPPPLTLAGKERLLTSRLERLQTLQKRLGRIEQAQTNLDLVLSEQDRLLEQLKLIRAEGIAAKNPDNLSARIDLSLEHVAHTNKWLNELAEFKDLSSAPLPGATASPTNPGRGPQATPPTSQA